MSYRVIIQLIRCKTRYFGKFGHAKSNRDKNLQALIDLEITRVRRKELLNELKIEDYFRGPTKDIDNGPDLWEFGRLLKQKEVYIKITIGMMNKPVICISFHLAERAIECLYKK